MDGGPTDDATRESVSSRTRDASRVRFILVEPQFGGNVGSAARAIKNLGFTRLDVVAPACDPFAAEARRMAVDAVDVIEAIRVYPDLDAALEDAGTVVGTSRRTGKQRRPHFRMDEIAARLAGLSRAAPLAIVFGREAHGLNDAELDRCTHLVHLLADVAYPSFNLAQAVLLVAYEMRRALDPRHEGALEPPAGHAEREAMYTHLSESLLAIGFLKPDTADGMMRRIRRMLGRAARTVGDVQILRGVARQTLWVAGKAGLVSPGKEKKGDVEPGGAASGS